MPHLSDDLRQSHDEAPPMTRVLEAIDRLIDAMEDLEAPITRELLGTAMMALVHECELGQDRRSLN